MKREKEEEKLAEEAAYSKLRAGKGRECLGSGFHLHYVQKLHGDVFHRLHTLMCDTPGPVLPSPAPPVLVIHCCKTNYPHKAT